MLALPRPPGIDAAGTDETSWNILIVEDSLVEQELVPGKIRVLDFTVLVVTLYPLSIVAVEGKEAARQAPHADGSVAEDASFDGGILVRDLLELLGFIVPAAAATVSRVSTDIVPVDKLCSTDHCLRSLQVQALRLRHQHPIAQEGQALLHVIVVEILSATAFWAQMVSKSIITLRFMLMLCLRVAWRLDE